MKAMSNAASTIFRPLMRSISRTLKPSSISSALRFSRIIWQALRDCSMKQTDAAPRLIASMPIAPTPAQPSRNVAPSTRAPRMLNNVSLSLSLVGRIPAGGMPFRCRLLNLPAIIRITQQGKLATKRHKRLKSFCDFVLFCGYSLSHGHKPCAGREGLDQSLAFLGAIDPALRFFLGKRQQFAIGHQVRDTEFGNAGLFRAGHFAGATNLEIDFGETESVVG